MSDGSKILLIVAIILVVLSSGFYVTNNARKKQEKIKEKNNSDFSDVIDQIAKPANKTAGNNAQENNKSGNISNNEVNTKQILLNVINNKQKFLDENNKEVFLKDFKVIDNQNAEVDKYAFIDMDKDGIEELIIYTTSDNGTYVMFHYENSKVYGYRLGTLSLENLKTDGTFMENNGDNYVEYLRMTFNKNSYFIKKEAVYDKKNKDYEIDNTSVSKEDIEEYVDNWNKKENASWIQ